MKFKEGDRVHVSRLNNKDVDFYGTLEQGYSFSGLVLYKLVNCTNSDYENEVVCKEKTGLYGKRDYYTLATDEEDSEESEIQYIKRENEIELENHYIIEVKKGLYVRNATSNYFFKFTNDINKADVYEYENAALKHAEFVDGRVLNLERHVEVE